MEPVALELKDVSISLRKPEGWFRYRSSLVLEEVSLQLRAGEIVAVIGASGSGKTLLAQAIFGFLPAGASLSGEIRYGGERLEGRRLRRLRGKELALIPQSISELDPLMTAGRQVRLAAGGNGGSGGSGGDRAAAQRAAFRRYGLGPEVERLYPFQLSGGMARRVLVAMAAVSGAKVIVADEPTPGIDPGELAEALRHFRELADQGCAVLLISHDIESALAIADKVAVFYAGTIVELAQAADFGGAGEGLRHPFSRALWLALPGNGFMPLPGRQPAPGEPVAGCRFLARCTLATTACAAGGLPAWRQLREGSVRCIHAT